MSYRNAQGVTVTESTGCRDKAAAQAVLATAIRDAERLRAGIATDATVSVGEHSATEIGTHFVAWIASLTAGGRSRSYAYGSHVYLKRLQRECGLSRLSDLTYETLDKWIRGRKLSARSRNAYRETLVAFCSWCVSTGRLISNPFLAYPVANVAADPRRPRRAFTDAELRRLLRATKPRSANRAFAYRVMALTGLRVGELRSLRIRDFRDGALWLAASDAKNRKASRIALRPDLARDIATWVRGKSPESALIPLPKVLSRRFAGDRKAAGIDRLNEAGRVVDAHSLRHTFCTAMARAGVAPRVAQKLMRHSSITLTMKFYTDAAQLDDAAALDSVDLLK